MPEQVVTKPESQKFIASHLAGGGLVTIIGITGHDAGTSGHEAGISEIHSLARRWSR